MTKIFLLLSTQDAKSQIYSILSDVQYEIIEGVGNLDEILTQIKNFIPDIILLDNDFENCEFALSQMQTISKSFNTRILLIANNDCEINLCNFADCIIQTPINDKILVSQINSNFNTKASLDRLHENNKELSRSLYQLNVLYNTSSQFAGTLNTSKLYDIMIEAMEKTLSFDISSAFIINVNSSPVFNLNTIHVPSENLIDALKIRSILNYKNMLDDNSAFLKKDFENIETIQKTKQTRSNKVFGIETINYDSLFAPIKVGEDFFGVIELFRQTPFSPEDVTCFQAITHQVALPLRSAKLYEEISITNKKLEKLEKLKSEFISIVSHELRTPLTPINNSLEIVLSGQAGELSNDAKNFISMAKRNIQRLSGIIEDLLDLSRIQAGKLDFKYKIANIEPSLELLKNTFLQVANEKNIKINLNITEKLPDIYADIRRIEQIFSNLVSNSIKFTQDDGIINIKVDIINEKDINYDDLINPVEVPCGNYIKISVKDNGIGIKKEDIPKIFDKFSQIESSLNRNKGGVGLGLAITKQLIDSHFGLIEVVSEEKNGSEFCVYLPLLNDLKIFKMDLSKALIDNDDVGILKIQAKKELDLINILSENKLLNLAKISKSLTFDKDGFVEYYAFIPKVSQSSFDALFVSISEFCSKIQVNKHDIILNKIHSTNHNKDINEIFKILIED